MDDGLHDPHHTKAEFSYYFIIHFEYFYILLKTFPPLPPLRVDCSQSPIFP